MTNEKGFAAYHVLGHVADDLILDALLPEDQGVTATPVKKERSRRLSAFLESGWGVGIICALVAVSVMGGIIWAGNQPGTGVPPGGTVELESETIRNEVILPPDANHEGSRDVEINGPGYRVLPIRFFAWSQDMTEDENGMGQGVTADGLGFLGTMTYTDKMPELPEVSFVKNEALAGYFGILRQRDRVVERVTVYDMDMKEVLTETVGEDWNYSQCMSALAEGRYYVSLYVTHKEGSTHSCGSDYAYLLTVTGDVEITKNCTVKTDKDRYEWGNPYYFIATLISTVEGAYLQVDDPGAWSLVNLVTGERGSVSGIDSPYDTMFAPTSPMSVARASYVLYFGWETTPPGRYRLTYTGTELSEGEEYPYYDFEVYYDVEWVEVTDRCTIRTDKDRYEWGKEKLATYTVDLTCTVAGVILDISKYDFELVNLDTGKPATVIYMETTAHVDTSKAYPTAPDAFAQRQKTFLFDWETTPPGHYRLTYKGMELSEGEEYPYCDFEIYTPEPRMAVWDGDTYVIPAEALRWMEAWDDASQTMTESESPGWGDIEYFLKYHLLEVPVMDVAPDADIRVAGAEITHCEIYHSDGEIVYQGDSWETAMECVLKTPADTACFVVFTADWQGDYVAEANAYESRVYEYAFCLVVRDW